MSEQRSLIAHGQYQAAQDKFEYFLCGVAGALFAYIGQHYAPHKLGLNAPTVELLSLGLLGASFVAGVLRIERIVLTQRINHVMLDAAEKAGHFTKALATCNPNAPFYDAQCGDVYTAASLEKMRKEEIARRDEAQKNIQVIKQKGLQLYKWRNWLLYAGFATMLLAKLLSAYLP
jgi:hypothetical protein